MSTALSGVFSGIDSASIVSQLMAINSKPLTNLQTKKAKEQNKQAAVSDLESRFDSLRDLLDKLRDAKTLQQVSVNSSDSTVLTATAGTGSGEGTHTVVVNQLATTQRRIQTTGLAATDTLVGAGTFEYTYKGVTRTLRTTDTSTLANLRDLINNDGANPGVSASLLQFDGSYHLVLTGRDTGADNTITITGNTTLSGFASGDIAVTQEAHNAQLRVDGFPAATWIDRSSNSVSDVIDGVTLTLRKAGTVDVTLSRDTSDLKNDMANLVAIYNGLSDKMATYTGYNAETKQGGILQGDSMVTTLLQQFRSVLVSTPAGFASGQDAYTLAGDIGLNFDKTGKLTLDDDVLSDALDTNYLGVLSLLGAAGTGLSSSDNIQFTSATSGTAGGTYDVSVDYKADGGISTARIRKQGTDAWEFLDIHGAELDALSGSPLFGLKLTAINDGTSGAHTQTATVRVRQGLAGVAYKGVASATDETSGAFTAAKKRSDDSITNINNNITTMQTRLDKQQAALKAQFARMEATLAKLDSQRAAVTALNQTTSTVNASNSSSSSSSS